MPFFHVMTWLTCIPEVKTFDGQETKKCLQIFTLCYGHAIELRRRAK